MKKSIGSGILLLCTILLLLTMTAACSLSTSQADKKEVLQEESSVEEEEETEEEGFNPDKEKDALTIEEFRNLHGEEVPVPKDVVIAAMVKSLSNEFWRTFQSGYEDMAMDCGIAMKIAGTESEEDEGGQLSLTQQMIKEGGEDLDAILLCPITDDNLLPAVKEACQQGIVTINVNDGLIEQADYYVGPNSYKNGWLAAEWISKKLEDQGQVAIIKGIEDSYASRERTKGFEEWIQENDSGLRLIGEENADWDRARAKDIAIKWMTMYPGLKAIFCNNDDMALGVEEAVEEHEKDILVVGVDGIGEAYESIRQGKLDATVDSFPYYMAKVALECTLRAIAGQELPSVITTPQALIDIENVDQNKAEMIHWVEPIYIKEWESK